MKKIFPEYMFLIFILLATLFVANDWWNPYLLYGHSSGLDFSRMLVLDENVRQGLWWPRYAEAFYHGYGSPLFHYYAPLGYWLTETLVLLGLSIPVAMKTILGATVFFSGLFAGLLAKESFGNHAGIAAGVFYILAPYHLVDIFVRHSMGEAIAFTWIPLALWGVMGAIRKQSLVRMLLGAAGISFLLLTHSITSLIFAPLLFFWWLFWAIKCKREGWLGPFLGASAAVTGLLLASFFWLPAFMETDLVWSKKSLTEGYYSYKNHFVYLQQFFDSHWGYGVSRAGLQDTLSFQLGLAHWFALGGLLPLTLFYRKHRQLLLFWLLVFFAALFMCHEGSAFIWQKLPLLQFIQFPWRFLVIVCLASSLLIGLVCEWLSGFMCRNVKVGVYIVVAISLMPFFFYHHMTEAKYMVFDTVAGKTSIVSEVEALDLFKSERYQPIEVNSNADTIRDNLVAATARDDWLPIDVEIIPRRRVGADSLTRSGVVLNSIRLAPCNYEVEVELHSSGPVYLNRFWFPGWSAKIDGVEAKTFPATRMGVVAVSVPKGKHTIMFYFGTTELRQLAWGVSALGLISGLSIIVVVCLFRRKRLINRAL